MSTSSVPTRWDDLKQRLQQTTLTAQQVSSRDSRRKTDVYRHRAALFASPESVGNDDAAPTPTLVLMLGEQRFGIALHHVAQVYPDRLLTPVPRSPSWILGIASFEGRIRAVVDLAGLLEACATEPREAGRFLLVRSAGRTTVVRVNCVEGIRKVDFSRLVAPDQQSNADKSGLVIGAAPDHLVVLCADALLARTA